MNNGHSLDLAFASFMVLCSSMVFAFSVDTSEQPASHPALTPKDGAKTITNPPAMIWRFDERAATYILEMCQSLAFDKGVIRVEGIDMPFYNHSATLAEGIWHWRYYVVTSKGERSDPSPVKRFVITKKSIPFPVPKTEVVPRQHILDRLVGEVKV